MSFRTCRICGDDFIPGDDVAETATSCARCYDRERSPRNGDDDSSTPRRPRARRPAPRRRKSNALRAWAIALVVVFFLCAGGTGAFWYVFLHEIDEPVAAADKEVVVDAEYVATFMDDFQVDATRGKFSKVRHLDGSKEMVYEYESADDAKDTLNVNCTVVVEKSPRQAHEGYGGLNIATKLILRNQDDVTQLERPDLWQWGDQSRCIILQNKAGLPVGNIFMGQKGKRYFMLIVSGVYFNKKDAIKAFLDPMLLKIDAYNG